MPEIRLSTQLPARPTSRAARQRRGSVIIWVAVSFLLLLGALGLAMDAAYIVGTLQELQAVADASALAGADQLVSDPSSGDPDTPYKVSRQTAVDFGLANSAAKVSIQLDPNTPNAPDGDVVLGVWDSVQRQFLPDLVAPDSVRVVARRSAAKNGGLTLLFGRVFGLGEVALERSATATVMTSDETVILILDPVGGQALSLKGGAAIRAFGKVQVNSSASDALYLNGSPDVPRLQAKRTNVHGGASVPSGTTIPPPFVNQPVIPDYLMYLPDHPDPTKTQLPVHGVGIVGPGTYTPGHYTRIEFSDGAAQLQPGVYVIGRGGIKLTADAQLLGEGVTLFIEGGGGVQIAGQGMAGMAISAPTSGIFKGICLYMSRLTGTPGYDDAKAFCNIQGGGLFDVRGTMYVKNARIEMDGNVYRRVGSIVAFRQLVRGTARYDITGEGPGAPVPPTVALVE